MVCRRRELFEHGDTRLVLALFESTVDQGSLSDGQLPFTLIRRRYHRRLGETARQIIGGSLEEARVRWAQRHKTEQP
jgi:hypothetical protein